MPSTGNHVWAAITPARCAAPPAPAIITRIPRSAALRAKSVVASGLRCAERILCSLGTASSSRSWTEWRIVSQSDALPMTTATNAGDFDLAIQIKINFKEAVSFPGKLQRGFWVGTGNQISIFFARVTFAHIFRSGLLKIDCAYRFYGNREICRRKNLGTANGISPVRYG